MNSSAPAPTDEREELTRERSQLLERLEDWLELPMVVLGLVWLALLVVDLVRGLPPVLAKVSTGIWVVFILDFLLKFTLAPVKLRYLRQNWLTVVALLLPALRVLRIARAARVLRAARAARGVRLVRVVGSVNRGMGALAATMGRRGFGYAAALTVLVTFAGAAGMFAFEKEAPGGGGLHDYGTALWWTAMVMTTMGSEYWPRTAEGRLLCLLLSLYAFTMFGYLTATLASFFIGRDAENDQAEVAGAKDLEALRLEIRSLREEIREMTGRQR